MTISIHPDFVEQIQAQVARDATLVATVTEVVTSRTNGRQTDTIRAAVAISESERTQAKRAGLDPGATLPKPKALNTPTGGSNQPYTIWSAIAAVAALFAPEALTSNGILEVLNNVSTTLEDALQKVQSYQDEVNAVQDQIKKESTSEQWLNWGMAVMGVVFGALAGFAIGGPAGAIAGAAIGIANLLLGSQISIGGKPLLNWVVDKVTDGKVNMGNTSVYGYIGEGVYEALGAMGMPKTDLSKEIVEGITQIGLGLVVGFLAGSFVGSAIEAATAAESITEDLVEDTESELTEEAAANKNIGDDEINAGGIEMDDLGGEDTEIETDLEESSTARSDAQQQIRKGDEPVVEKKNPGGIEKKAPRAGIRGFVYGLSSANNVAGLDTGGGSAYQKLLEACGVSSEVAGYVSMGIQVGVTIATGLAGLKLGSIPGANMGLMMKLFQYAGYTQPLVSTATGLAEGYKDYQIYELYDKLANYKTDLDNENAVIETTQLFQKSAVEMMNASMQITNNTMETAAGMLNSARQMVEGIFQA